MSMDQSGRARYSYGSATYTLIHLGSLFGGLLITGLLQWLLTEQGIHLPNDTLALLAIVMMLIMLALAWFYTGGMKRSVERHNLNPDSLPILAENIWISFDDFEADVRGRLVERILTLSTRRHADKPLCVHLATRNSIWELRFKQTGWTALALFTTAGWLVAVQSWPRFIWVWLWVGAMLLLGIASFNTYLKWRYVYLVVTDTFVTWLPSYPPIFWWLESNKEPIPLRKVDEAKIKDTLMGNRLHYGILKIDTASDQDERFHRLPWLPDHEYILGIVQSAIDAVVSR